MSQKLSYNLNKLSFLWFLCFLEISFFSKLKTNKQGDHNKVRGSVRTYIWTTTQEYKYKNTQKILQFKCSHTNVTYVLACSVINVSCVLTCLRASVSSFLTCSRANLPWVPFLAWLAWPRDHLATCLACLENRFDATFLLSLPLLLKLYTLLVRFDNSINVFP